MARQLIRKKGSAVLTGSSAGNFLATATSTVYYGFVSQNQTGTEIARQVVIPFACIAKNFCVSVYNVPAGVATSWTFTVRKNEADTALVVAIAGASQVNGEDTTNRVRFDRGDRICIKCDIVGVTADSMGRWGLELEKV